MVSKFISHLISPDIPLSTIRLQPSSLLLLVQKQPCRPHPVMLGNGSGHQTKQGVAGGGHWAWGDQY